MARRRTDEDSRHPPGFTEALGRTIKVIRTDLGIERRDLAERAGISYSYITEIENGNKPPSSSVLGPIASALGLRMSQLIEAAEGRMETQGTERNLNAPPEKSALYAQYDDQAWVVFGDYSPMRPSLRGPSRDRRTTIIELERLLRDMAPEDVERLLDYARRLAR
ncbi:MAG: helix-turn-helix transcriptional regulator [Actinobacteria bacterium]|jgi:transcriptional regulator with XRE-family HTH domain|nr:helix-turn-helix transcriptional regulator [Actinomycetota bacterium]